MKRIAKLPALAITDTRVAMDRAADPASLRLDPTTIALARCAETLRNARSHTGCCVLIISLPTTQTEQGLYSATAPAEVAEHPALTAAVAHSARPRPMVTPVLFLVVPSAKARAFLRQGDGGCRRPAAPSGRGGLRWRRRV